MPFDLARFRERLLDWFAASARDLPWRRDYAPYRVLVSEVMLQQTQMERVVPYFERFLARFPDFDRLAAAGEDELLSAWEGLGYYARARNLQKTARAVVAAGGRLPEEAGALRELPGVGPYTAAAVAAIAFNRDEAVLDANVERVLSRVLDVDEPVKAPAVRRQLAAEAARLLPPGRARDFNQAMMELGALVCTARSPRCANCPLREDCEALHLGIVNERPVPGKRVTFTPLVVASGVVVRAGRVFIQRRLPQGVWAGLWEFPGGRVEPGESPAAAVVREIGEETELAVAAPEHLALIRHGYTTYRVELHCFLCAVVPESPPPVLHAAQEYRWARLSELDGLAFPAGHRKLIDRMRQDIRLCELMEG